MGAAALSMDDTLGNALAVEMREKVDQVEVLEEERAIVADTLRLIWMGRRRAVAGGVDCLCGGGVAIKSVSTRPGRGGKSRT